MSANSERERYESEVWKLAGHPDIHDLFALRDDGAYADARLRLAWTIWQAALSSPHTPPAGPPKPFAVLCKHKDFGGWNVATNHIWSPNYEVVEVFRFEDINGPAGAPPAPAVEPAAYLVTWPDHDQDLRWEKPESSDHYPDGPARVDPLCKCAPAQPVEPVALTDARIWELYNEHMPDDLAFARAVIAAAQPVAEGVQLTQRQAFEGGKMIGKILGARVTDEMVTRFLCWKLPDNFSPDCGITFKRTHSETGPFGPQKHEPTGTNLLDAAQARAMLEHVIGTAVEPVALTDGDIRKLELMHWDSEGFNFIAFARSVLTVANILGKPSPTSAQEVEFTDDPVPTYKPGPPLEWEKS